MKNNRTFASATARSRRGLTLVELLVVLVVLIVVSVILVPLLGNLTIGSGNTRKSPQQIATEATMEKVRDAILGTPSQPGMWNDLGQRDTLFPQTMLDLFVLPSAVPSALQSFDPNSRLGWRGPYLQSSGARYGTKFPSTPFYGNPTDPAVIDGWGNPIIIQYPASTETNYAQFVRLVSAGPNGNIDTPQTDTPALSDCKDDIVLYLRAPDTRQ